MNWTVALAVFLASAVEFVEALTIVLAVGVTRGFRTALMAALLAMVVLAILVTVLGSVLVSVLPLEAIKVAVGGLLLLFGVRWLRKAILRQAGLKSFHDEDKAFKKTVDSLSHTSGANRVAFLTAFNGVFLEGVEVIFIILTLGATGSNLGSAMIGAGAGLVMVVGAGVLLRAPLTRVPENTLKFAVGLLLTTFGVFWVGEGLGTPWPAGDTSILILLALFGLTSWILVRTLARKKEVARA